MWLSCVHRLSVEAGAWRGTHRPFGAGRGGACKPCFKAEAAEAASVYGHTTLNAPDLV